MTVIFEQNDISEQAKEKKLEELTAYDFKPFTVDMMNKATYIFYYHFNHETGKSDFKAFKQKRQLKMLESVRVYIHQLLASFK